jgi:cobalt-zinc-cadmium efflux system membrane fusion protein
MLKPVRRWPAAPWGWLVTQIEPGRRARCGPDLVAVFTPLALCALLLASNLGAQAAAAAAVPQASVSLQAAQVQALGIVSQRADASAATAASTYPARVVVPPTQQRVVATPLPGLLLTLTVAAGDTVAAGQRLGTLRSLQVQELQRDGVQAGSQAALAAQVLARDEQLFSEGLIAQSRLQASRAAQQQAQALATERQRALALTGAGAGLDVRGAGAPGGEAGGALALTSPIAGTVLEVGATPGQRIDSATPVARIAALGTLWLELQVGAADADSLQIGSAVQVVGQAASGRVLRIGQAVDPATQTVLVRAELSGAAASRVRPGQLLEVQVAHHATSTATAAIAAGAGTAAPGAAVTLLPAAAVLRLGTGQAVFVEGAAGQYTLQPVQARPAAGGRMAVSGLAPGARVVVQGTAALLALAKP